MRLSTSTTCVAAATLFAALGFALNSFDMLFASGIVGGAGLALRVAPRMAGSWRRALVRRDGRLEHLERHLRVTEDELDSVTRELRMLKEQHDFDLDLRTSNATPRSQPVSK
jgi:hypothetical protein